MKLEKLLAENMLRFGTKNLSESIKLKLAEQTVEQPADIDANLKSVANPQAIPVTGVAASIGFNAAAVKTCDNKASINIKNNIATQDDQNKLISQLEQNTLYQQLLTAFKQDNDSNTITIWFSKLTQDSRLVFLQQFTDWWSAASKKVRKGKRSIKADINTAGSPRREKISIEGEAPTAVPDPVVMGLEMSGDNVYADNESIVTPALQAKINELVSQAKVAVEAAALANASVTCNKIEVASSCSRLRNTEDAANMTWADLSKARASNVTEAIKTGLKSVGVIVSDSIVVELRGGYNGDGSSGPNPPKEDSKGKSYSLTSDGKTIITDETQRNKKFPVMPPDENNPTKIITQPSSNIADYAPFKFCIANVTLQTTWKLVPDLTEAPFIYKRFKSYQMEISEVRPVPGNARTLDFKKISFKRPSAKASGIGTSCPLF